MDNLWDCPDVDGCGIHYRVNMRHRYDTLEIFTYVDYLGEYAVVSGINTRTDFLSQAPLEGLVIEAFMSALVEALTVDPYETFILRVGHGSAFTAGLSADEKGLRVEDITLWRETYTSYDAALSGHDMVVQAVRDGIIDLKGLEL